MREGLDTVKLAIAVEVIMGQAPAGRNCNKEGIGTPFVKVGEFSSERPLIREWTTDPKKMAKKTDVLLCVVGATCGKINLGEDCAIGRSVAAIRPRKEKILQHYLHYFMHGKVEELRQASQGAAQTVISRSMIADIEIPLPPLPKQKRIVATLDEAFEGIDKVVANTKKNLANARELFDSYLNNIFTQKGDGWNEKRLGDVCNIIGGGTPKSNVREYWGGDVLWITPKDMGKLNNKYVSTTSRKITQQGLAKSSAKLIPANSVILSTRAPIGHLVINTEPMATNQGCRGLIPSSSLDAKFLFYFLRMNVSLLNDLGSGTTFKELSKATLAGVEIPLPPLSEQRRIVAKLDVLRVETQRLEAIYQQKLTALTELKQSFLQRAFTGELTAEDKTIKIEAVA